MVNDILKQRLVGALILVALGVVFWPIIFVEPGDKAVAQHSSIPPRPQVATTLIEAPDLAGLRASPERAEPAQESVVDVIVVEDTIEEEIAPPAIDKPAPAPTVTPQPVRRTRSEAPQKLALDADGVPLAWILQVASVSSADKADQLRRRLLAMKQKAYVKKVHGGGKVLYRVYIGPKFERAALETTRIEIDAEFGVKSMIARYYP